MKFDYEKYERKMLNKYNGNHAKRARGYYFPIKMLIKDIISDIEKYMSNDIDLRDTAIAYFKKINKTLSPILEDTKEDKWFEEWYDVCNIYTSAKDMLNKTVYTDIMYISMLPGMSYKLNLLHDWLINAEYFANEAYTKHVIEHTININLRMMNISADRKSKEGCK